MKSRTIKRWAICADGWPLTFTIARTRKIAVAEFIARYSGTWKEARAAGYTVEKITITTHPK